MASSPSGQTGLAMRSRSFVLLTFLVLLFSPLATAFPAGDGAPGTPTADGGDGIMLYLKAGTFDPVVDKGPGPSWLRDMSTHPYYVVQFDGPIQKAWRDAAAEAGADLLDYLPDWGYFARIRMGDLDNVRELDHVRYVGPAHLAYRIDPALWGPFTEPIDLEIVTWGYDAASWTAWEILREGGQVLFQDDDHVTARLYPAFAMSLATDPSLAISWIEPRYWPEPLLDNDARSSNARQASDGAYQTNDQSAWSYNAATDEFEGWTGKNVTVTVADSGLDDSHPGFTDRIVHYYDYNNNGQLDTHGHGTHCSGIVLGDGSWRDTDTGKDGKYAGLAPGAGLVVQEAFTYGIGPSRFNRDAVQSGSTISSNSWGYGEYGAYDSICTNYDDHTRDADSRTDGDQPLLFTFSAGNDGSGANTVTPPATAKNVITVGAAGNDKWGLSSDNVAGFSSRGPLDDGRLKPDVVMPGHQVVSTRSTDPNACSGWSRPADGQTSYVYASGTSMAAPGVAGAAAIVTQYLVEEKDMDPSPAMLKASLINGARPLPGYEYPGMVQGWGSVDVANTIFEASNYTIYRDDQSIELDTVEGEDIETYWFMVESDTPLKVSLVWTDPGGTATSTKHLINDLDLVLTSPDGKRYAGNLFENGQSKIDDGFYQDRVNNVEGFHLNNPTRGIWTITVNVFNAPEGPQDYALVVSGNAQKGHVDLNPSALAATPSDLEEYDTVNLETTMKNLGNRMVDIFDILVEQVDPDGKVTILHDANFSSLGAGRSTQMAWNFTGKRGTHTLRVSLDPKGLVSESDETNNVLEVEYFFKGYDVGVSAQEAEVHVDPGDLVDFNLSVRNSGNVPDEFRVSITSAPPGWSAQLVADTFALDAGITTPVIVTVIAPSNATADEFAEITFTATSLGNTTKTRTLQLTTVVNQIFGLELSAPRSHLEMLPGDEADFTLRINNPGNGPDRYEVLMPTGFDAGWFPTIPEPYVVLQHRSNDETVLRLAAPNPAFAGTSEEFTITVRSTKSGLEAKVTLSAEVIQFYENGYTVSIRDVEGEVGSDHTFPVTIDNRGNGPVNYVLSLGAPTPEWAAGFELPNVTIPGYGWTTVNVTFNVPLGAEAGASDFSLAVIPSGGDRLQQNFTFNVLQYHDLEMSITSQDATVTQGMDVRVDLRVRNMGNGVEDVKVLLPDLPDLWTYDMESDTVSIPAFGTMDLTLVVHTNRETRGAAYPVRIVARYGPPPQATSEDIVKVTILTRADLVVRNGLMEISEAEVFEGTLVQLTISVENLGETGAKDIYVQFYIDGAPMGQPQYIPEMAPGVLETLTTSWNANVTGLHELSATVDFTGDIDELSEDNNRASTQVNVEPLVLKTSPGFGPVAMLIALATLGIVVGLRRRRDLR